MENKLLHSDITEIIIKAFYNVYNVLGYGFLEKVYENAMLIELKELGLNCFNQQGIVVFYKGNEIGHYIADINVENKVVVELKAVESIAPIHEVVLVNYLKATGVEVGLLMNFGPKPKYIRKVLTQEYRNGEI
jgi:GxxExxY protein